MRARNPVFAAAALVLFGIVHGCGQGAAPEADGIEVFNPLAHPEYGPPAGNPDGASPIPAEAGPAAITAPDHVIGNGTPESCTAQAFLDAVAQGGTIVFNGGTEPFTIRLEQQACDDQDHPRLTVQNLTFANGNAINDDAYDGGGAIWVRGGRFKAVNCRFFNNRCAYEGPDVGGGAIRVFDQYQDQPVYLVNCTFGGGDEFGNVGANGGGISSIGVSWTIINCLFAGNRAVGSGGNPAQQGTPGGGSGGAIYNDGNTMTLTISGCLIEDNVVNAYGAAIFFVTNDHSGNIRIEDSVIRANTGGSWYPAHPGISMHADTPCVVVNSTIE
ncbi:MAG: hypothetical protein IPP62_15945 [bacterium]|nr:hypothetical protein [bacterium]